jgi:spermidine/putrescine-binding protein
VNRRGLLRSGALIVGAAAGGAAAAALTGTTAAQAADGDTLLVGWSNEAGADRRVVHRPRAP